MYRKTMALRSNPFGPVPEKTPENLKRLAYLTNLDRKPLRLDQHQDLNRLFCSNILGLDKTMAKFHQLMMKLNYRFDGDGERGLESVLVVIRGSIGAGKTTLGAWMIAEIARLPGDEPLKIVESVEPSEDTASAFRETLKGLKADVEKTPHGHHVAALIRNVTCDTLNSAISCYNSLDRWARLFVLTTSDLKLLNADERALGGNVEIAVFDLPNVESADADAYLEHRLPQFRDPERQEILDLSPVFPFPRGLAGRCVKRDGPSAAPIVLRQMNAHFRKVLADHAMALSGQPEPILMETLPAADLPRYLISEDALMLTSGK